MNKTYRYHPTEKPKLVDLDDTETLEALEQAGWRDTPAAFKDQVVEPDEPDEVPEANAGELKSLLDRFNEDPEQMTKDELVKLGRYLGIKMMKAWKEETLINKVRSGLE